MPFSKDQTSYITGAASGLGKALTEHLVANGGRVIIVDLNEAAGQKFAEELNAKAGRSVAIAVKADTTVWEDQVAAWDAGVKAFGRIDYVFANAGIAEYPWLPPSHIAPAATDEITKPNFLTLNIDLIGQLNTAGLALQHFQRQAKGAEGFKGKLILTASVFGFYPCATMPMYTAAKAGVVNFMRSTSQFYADKGITINCIAPNLIETGVAPPEFYKPFRDQNLLTEMDLVIKTFDSLLGASTVNGEAVSINQKDVWNNPQDGFKWKDNQASCEMISVGIGALHGYPTKY